MAKDKRRNSEKRKEKSRDAARCRRGKESEIFNELAQALPLTESMTSQLDKASIMRLSISMLKIYNILSASDQHQQNESDDDSARNSESWDHLYQKALEGFAFILSCDGDIVYLSESVSKYLGLQQIELIGQSIYEFAHPCDHEEIRELLAPKHNESSDSQTASKAPEGAGKLDHTEIRTQIFRLKCTLTSKGRNVNLKSATYKPMNFTGRLLLKSSEENSDTVPPTAGDSSDDSNTSSGLGVATGFPFLVGVAEPIPHPSNIEVPLDSKTFLSKHSMDMHFLFCDDRIKELAGFATQDMIGKSIYDFHHGLDCGTIEKAFKDLFSKGQTVTQPYRFLAKEGGYMWVVTQATVINNSRTLKPQSVVCVHYVVSGVEQQNLILSHVQEPQKEKKQINPLLEHLPPKVELSTENIFAPKPKDMDESFFIPPQLKDTIEFLNEEPDLSYLAPNAGDFLPDVLLDKDTPTRASPEMCNLKQEPDCMPDTSYRTILSPGSILSSNSSSRIASPKEYLNMTPPMETFFQSMDKLNTVDSLGTDDEDSNYNIDFSGRAPYIPMDADQDLGLCPPTASVLFTQSEDLNPGLFGQTEQVFGPKQSLFEEPPQPPKLSIQDMLGGSTAVASIEQPVDTMYLQMKRPLDMNSLEKGPPKPKQKRLEHSILQQQLLEQVVPQQPNEHALPPPLSNPIPAMTQQGRQQLQLQTLLSAKPKAIVYPQKERRLSKDSMLLSLLLSGNERNYDYNRAAPRGQKLQPHQMLLPNLTTQECEVNAPASTTHLLQGRELLSALEGNTRSGL